MAGPHAPCRGRRIGFRRELGPPFAHVGGVERGGLGVGVGAGVDDQEAGRIGPAAGEAERHGEHHRVGRLAPHALPDRTIVALRGGPEAPGGGVR